MFPLKPRLAVLLDMKDMKAEKIKESGLDCCFEVGDDFAREYRTKVIGFH